MRAAIEFLDGFDLCRCHARIGILASRTLRDGCVEMADRWVVEERIGRNAAIFPNTF